MRPRLGGRGSLLAVGDDLEHRARFNEAPAWWPGKSRQESLLERFSTGFNEAPAWWPGKSRPSPVASTADPVASMRPRLGGRGSKESF